MDSVELLKEELVLELELVDTSEAMGTVSPMVVWWYNPSSKELLEEGVEVELLEFISLEPRSEDDEEESLCMARMTKRTRAAMMTVQGEGRDGGSQQAK